MINFSTKSGAARAAPAAPLLTALSKKCQLARISHVALHGCCMGWQRISEVQGSACAGVCSFGHRPQSQKIL